MKKTEENQVKCECGCIVDRSELAKVIVKEGRLSRPYVCCPHHPEHPGGKVVSRVFECVDCGKACFASVRATQKIRCDECQREKHLKTCRNWQKRNKHVRRKGPSRVVDPKAVEVSSERWDCEYRNECLNNAEREKLNVLPCLGCERYTPESMNVDPMSGEYRHGRILRIFT